MKVLLTGDDGYLGAVMAPALTAAGHQVVGLDTGLFDGCTFGEYQPLAHRLTRDLREVTEAELEGFEAIVHLAALSNDPLSNLDPSLTYDINHLASVRLARLAKSAGVRRFLFASSCSLYGMGSDDLLQEDASFNPITPYGISKVRVEEDVEKLADAGFSPTFLRNATAYGVSPKLRLDLVVNNLTGFACATGEVRLQSDGSAWRPLVHVEDIARAFVAVLSAPIAAIHNQAFNVGRTDENYQIREVAQMVGEAVPGSRITFAEGSGTDPRCYRVDCSKLARGLPEATPEWTVPRGIADLAAAFRREQFTRADCEGARFLRIARIRDLQDAGQLGPDLHWRRAGVAIPSLAAPSRATVPA